MEKIMLHVDDSYKLVLYMTVTNFGFIIYRRLRPKHSASRITIIENEINWTIN